jgi:hypothetical protein
MPRPLVRRLAIGLAVALATVVGATTPALAEAGGVISGRITSSGNPVASASVAVTSQFSDATISGTTTNADGSYRIENLAPGSYRIKVQAAGSMLTQYVPRQRSWSYGTVFELAEGQTLTVDEAMLGTGTLTGRITGATGPAADLGVSFYSGFSWLGAARTNATGVFTATVFEGDYRVGLSVTSQLTQWVPGKLAAEDATTFMVTAGGTTVADDTLLATGSISGRLLDNDGTPEAGAWITLGLSNHFGGPSQSTTTDAAGQFTFPLAFVGDYRVEFRTSDFARGQYAYQATSFETAAKITVNAGQNTVVNDTLLPIGNLEVALVDAVSGASVQQFCVYAENIGIGQGNACTENGLATLTLPAASYTLFISPDELHHFESVFNVAVVGNTTTRTTVKVRPAAVITTTVVDAATGEPVADTCLQAFTFRFGGTGDGSGWCTDELGKVRIGPLDGNRYTLFALPQDEVHGAQWVGANGGTGSQYKARIVDAEAGQVTEVPPVKLDKAGTVTGVITDEATGAPLKDTCAAFLPFNPSPVGNGVFGSCADANGRYTIANLGPYDWPIEFVAFDDHAWEWSGNATNRLLATPVKVSVGESATANAALGKGVRLTGRVLDASGRPIQSNVVKAYNVVTGDSTGGYSQERTPYDFVLHGNQLVHISIFTWEPERQFWYNRAKTVERATPVFIPATGTKTVDLQAPPN